MELGWDQERAYGSGRTYLKGRVRMGIRRRKTYVADLAGWRGRAG